MVENEFPEEIDMRQNIFERRKIHKGGRRWKDQILKHKAGVS